MRKPGFIFIALVSMTALPVITAGEDIVRQQFDLYGDPLPSGAVTRMGSERFWVGERISKLTFSHNGKTLASAVSGFEGIPIWEPRTGRRLRTLHFQFPNVKVNDGESLVQFSPLGAYLISDFGVDSILVWESSTWRLGRIFRGEFFGIRSLDFAGNGRFFVALCGDQNLHICDIHAGKEVRKVGLGGITSAVLSPDGSQVAVVLGDSEIRIWDVASGSWGRRLHQGSGHVFHHAFAPDGKTLAALYNSGSVWVWDLVTGRKVKDSTLQEWVTSCCPAFSRDNSIIAVGCADASLRIWESKSGRILRRIPFDPWTLIHQVSLSPDGKMIASVSGNDDTLQVWDIATGKETQHITRHQGAVVAVRFSPDDKTVASSGKDGTLILWDAATGKAIWRVIDGPAGFWDIRRKQNDREDLWEQVRPIGEIVFTPDGKSILSLGRSGIICFRSVETGRQFRQMQLEIPGAIEAAAFSPDCRMIATVSSKNETQNDHKVRFWNLATGKEVSGLSLEDESQVCSIAFAPSGHAFAATDHRGAVRVWDMQTRHLRNRFAGPGIFARSLAFSPANDIIAAGCEDFGLRLWSPSLKDIRQPSGEETGVIAAVAFSPNGKKVAWGAEDSIVRVWDVPNGREVARYSGHKEMINKIAFSSNSHSFASASRDGTILIWNTDGRKKGGKRLP